ncbi:YchJ family protein [Agromyces sp. NPDC056965]|uniref:YchJ family protein n=1 Tax=Agromyces sp. NPDC056965 TaxID=3345983 RepID=UPI00362B206D
MPSNAPQHRPADADRCPCRSGSTFGECCGPLLARTADAPTAVQLMRSRYTAFAIGDAEYLRATWHPETRPADLDLDDETTWLALEIVATERGGPFDRDGEVEFRATHRSEGERGVLHERSRFLREDGRWFYVDGDV